MIEVVPQKESKLIDNTSPITPTDKIVWNNYDNQHFYQTVAVEGLKELAEKGGLATGCDLALLKPYWSKANSILEVGAGYGRVINYLLEHGFSGEITAIERCDVFFDHLQKTFTNHANVKLMHEDILFLIKGRNKFIFENHFNLIFMLWYGIADFSEQDQSLIFIKLKTLLKKGGTIIIDTIPENTIPLSAVPYGKQNYLIRTNNTYIYVHLLNANEISTYAKNAGFVNIKLIKYQTNNHRERWLYIIN